MATAIKKPAISGPGLKKQGVVVLQSFFIFIFVWLEMWIRSGAGILSGLIICLVTYGGIAYGRTGTRYVAAVTPPLAYAATTLIYTILSDGLRPSRVGIDFIASLASVAPFLLSSALYGWFMFFNEKAKSRPSQRLQATPEVR
ncbi:hypothetical protein A1sIA53_00760 [Candidatus Planktophila dulcis]|uniref:hypothetical protein n=1 Tax=Candidatus Planktophila dulcis TaxID=1884914 RepID=UPI000BACB846|nr:hypothetical protein [Candidatus Planktophila dulcis]ASY14120.1 hypothetical protein A1sIA53_00760 [Candidatus Planktophila dulcis]